jgi:hypothetical protein
VGIGRAGTNDFNVTLFLSCVAVDNAPACLQTGYAGTKLAACCKQARGQLMY